MKIGKWVRGALMICTLAAVAGLAGACGGDDDDDDSSGGGLASCFVLCADSSMTCTSGALTTADCTAMPTTDCPSQTATETVFLSGCDCDDCTDAPTWWF